MDFPDNHIIEELYSSGLIADIESSPAYKEMLGEYNDLFDTVEDKDLKAKLERLEEMKNNLYSENDKIIFKLRLFNGNKNANGSINNKFINMWR